jgi:hypothetical protein
MDMRTPSKDDGRGEEATVKSRQTSVDVTNSLENYSDWNNNCTDTACTCAGQSSSDSAGLVSVRGSSDSAACDSCFIPTSGPLNSGSSKGGGEAYGSEYVAESYFDFPPLPVTNLFDKREDKKESGVLDDKPRTQRKLRFQDDRMHSFQINNNVDLIMESRGEPSNHTSSQKKSEIELVHQEDHVPVLQSNNLGYEKGIVNKLRIVDVPETPLLNAKSNGGAAGVGSVSEWLWTLHRIGTSVTDL